MTAWCVGTQRAARFLENRGLLREASVLRENRQTLATHAFLQVDIR